MATGNEKSVIVSSPATVSNVVCGFDCIGFALEEPADIIKLQLAEKPGITITHKDQYNLPLDPGKNTAGIALKEFIRASGLAIGFNVEIKKGIRPGSGIGSSAASSCGTLVAANFLTGNLFNENQLIKMAAKAESVVSGAEHFDNAAPCILGGMVLVRDPDSADFVKLRFPELSVSVVRPSIEILTSQARAVLPESIPLKKAVRYWSNLAGFIAAISFNDIELLSRAMIDNLIEPERAKMIPAFKNVKSAAISAGAVGAGISGSGPAIFAFSTDAMTAKKVAAAMSSVFNSVGLACEEYISRISTVGARVLTEISETE
ncbi:MAG TPA: homoserine kinase [Pyrinomonadaceae bacterium]|nr:homoserine kinase [Pyrinomonadaceae bacterium]